MPMNQFKGPPPTPTGIIPKLRFMFLQGGAAGPLTLTGIRKNKDYIVSVISLVVSDLVPWGTATDLTSQFSISADDTIDNTGGTATTLKGVFVVWYQNDMGEGSNTNPIRS